MESFQTPVRSLVCNSTTVPGILIAIDRILLSRSNEVTDWKAIINWNNETALGHPWADGRQVIKTHAEKGHWGSSAAEAAPDASANADRSVALFWGEEEDVRPSEEVVRVKKEAMQEGRTEEQEQEQESARHKWKDIVLGKQKEVEPPLPQVIIPRQHGFARMTLTPLWETMPFKLKQKRSRRGRLGLSFPSECQIEETDYPAQITASMPLMIPPTEQPAQSHGSSPAVSIHCSQGSQWKKTAWDILAPSRGSSPTRSTLCSTSSNTPMPSEGLSPPHSTHCIQYRGVEDNVDPSAPQSVASCDLCQQLGKKCIPIQEMACARCHDNKRWCLQAGRKRGRSVSRPPPTMMNITAACATMSSHHASPEIILVHSPSVSEPHAKWPCRESRTPTPSQSTTETSCLKSTMVSATLVSKWLPHSAIWLGLTDGKDDNVINNGGLLSGPTYKNGVEPFVT